MLVTPPIAASLGINHRQVYVSRGRLLVVIRNGVFGDVTVVNGVPVWPLAKIMLPPLQGSAERIKIRSACYGSATGWNFPHFLSCARAFFPTASQPVLLLK